MPSWWTTRTADMRYRGQGHEITVDLPAGDFDRRVAREADQALRGGLCRDLRPDHPGPQRRDHELDAAARRRAAAAAQGAAAARGHPVQGARQPAGLRSGRSGHEGRVGLSSRRPYDRQLRAGPRDHRRGRDDDHRAEKLRRPAQPDRRHPAGEGGNEHQRSPVADPPAADVGPPDRGRRGAGAGADAHRLLDLDPRGGRPVGRRVRPQRRDAGPGGHRHAGPHQLDGARGPSLPRQVPGADDEGRRHLPDQRPVEGHRPPARLHLRHADLPARQDGRPVRLDLPRRRHRRPRHGAPTPATGLRGRPLHPADALCAGGQGRPDAGRHRRRQRARADPGRGRPLLAGDLQRDRLPPPDRDDGRVRDRRPRSARRPHPRPSPSTPRSRRSARSSRANTSSR